MEQAHKIFGGHFRTAPLSFIEKPGTSTLRLICHHSKEDHLRSSMNSWIDPSVDPTRFYTVAEAAEFVSFFLL